MFTCNISFVPLGEGFKPPNTLLTFLGEQLRDILDPKIGRGR